MNNNYNKIDQITDITLSGTINFEDVFEAKHEMNAFTLAEVLITLGIIGVVAALTMPVLINKTQDKVLETQAKKCKNIIANGYKLMLAKNDVLNVNELPLFACNSENCLALEHKNVFNIADDSTKSLNADSMPQEYSIIDKEDKSPFKWEDMPYMFATTDGMIYGVEVDKDNGSIDAVCDVNNTKNPNTVSKDLYKFRFNGSGRISDVSEELATLNRCTLDNPENCQTQEACLALGCKDAENCAKWSYGGEYCAVVHPLSTI